MQKGAGIKRWRAYRSEAISKGTPFRLSFDLSCPRPENRNVPAKKILHAHIMKTVRCLADGLLPLVDQGPFGREGAEVGKLKIFGKKMGERGGVSPLFLGPRFLEPPKDSRDPNPNRP